MSRPSRRTRQGRKVPYLTPRHHGRDEVLVRIVVRKPLGRTDLVVGFDGVGRIRL